MKVPDAFMYLWSWSKEGLFFHDGLVYVSNKNSLCIQLVREYHNAALTRYPNINKAVELLSRNYFISHVYRFIKEYVASCETCSQAKSTRHRPYGKLAPLPVSDTP